MDDLVYILCQYVESDHGRQLLIELYTTQECNKLQMNMEA